MPDDDPSTCGLVEAAMAVLGRAWAGAVLEAMMDGAERFSEIRRAIPNITDTALTQRLKELCERGFAERTVEAGPPVVVRYTLTPAGRDTAPVLEALRGFSRQHPDLLRTPEPSASGTPRPARRRAGRAPAGRAS